ncbi:hypothetical protein BT96DRAFT_512273 [Gymnopus androsaceus JB14]|uniref:Uncharacterized protein n=1 Tax=Gymnopus androsaceus JB14 TaxID=1447944 RepID=A0A6A4I2C1_9AGAR|nr:hypothetical protein BT96DRAFT_512273 [Gymnopus androsaceus JB14]
MNHVPSAEDRLHVKEHLIQTQLKIAELESEIARVQTLLDALLLGRDKATKYIEAHRIFVSPMRRLPAETLSEIFVRCLPEDRYAVRDIAQALLLLTTVSREWRRTAIVTPALWSSLHIYLPSTLSSQAIERRVMGFALWLKRSGSLPIFISLHLEAEWHSSRFRTPHEHEV